MRSPHANRGATMIEVLVTIVIVVIGLLGLASLQARLQVAEMESYQRAQALILLGDMVNRMEANRLMVLSYVTPSPVGTGMTCPGVSVSSTRQQIDTSEWCNALQGAAETTGGSRVGAMVGARGCVQDLGNNEYLVTVAWQGMVPISAPPAGVSCGSGQYNDASTSCQDDKCRRAVTSLVRLALLW